MAGEMQKPVPATLETQLCSLVPGSFLRLDEYNCLVENTEKLLVENSGSLKSLIQLLLLHNPERVFGRNYTAGVADLICTSKFKSIMQSCILEYVTSSDLEGLGELFDCAMQCMKLLSPSVEVEKIDELVSLTNDSMQAAIFENIPELFNTSGGEFFKVRSPISRRDTVEYSFGLGIYL